MTAQKVSHRPKTPREPDRLAVALALVEQFQRAFQRDERANTVELARQLVALRAPMGRQWRALAQIVADNGEMGVAREAIELYFESFGEDTAAQQQAQYQKAGLFAQMGAWEDARTALQAVPPNLPDPASHAHSRGTAALYLGDTEEAREQLELAIWLQPRSGATWMSLATLVDFARESELADRIFANERAMENAAPNERAIYYYALGKAHADCGEHSRAFAAFANGASQLKPTMAYSRDRDHLMAREAVNGYDADRIAALSRRQSEPTGRTIFVTGLPRSGTTLVEQILTSHSAVSDGGEINRLSLLVKDIRGLSYPDVVRYVDEVGPSSAARLWEHWISERFPAPGRIVEKTINNTRLLGLAAALLPEAPLIWLRRDPLDCAWSCFRTFFGPSIRWSCDLQDIAFHFRLEDQLLLQWQDILGDRLLVVPYESLVTESERWIRRILSHCGLAEEPQAFAPHENRRAVTTSSVMQVRRPISREAIGSAEPYRPFLERFTADYFDQSGA
jgi:tetratricopeptide (TPR) repeat protein